MKKLSVNYLIALLLFFFCTSGIINAQNKWNYISPLPESKNINPENNIAFRAGIPIDIESVAGISFSVNGSVSGEVVGVLSMSTDGRTLLFNHDKPFAFGERIDAYLGDGLRDVDGNRYDSVITNFYVRDDYTDFLAVNDEQLYSEVYHNNYLNEDKAIFEELITYGDASLPENFNVPQIVHCDNPSPGLIFYSPEPVSDMYGTYAVAIDNYGVPVFYREWPSKAPSFQVVANNQLIHKNKEDGVVDKNSFLVLNSNYDIVDTLKVGNGYTTNTHDMLLLPNGNHYMIIYDPQPVGMDTVVEGGNPNATVRGFVLQELDPDHNVVFQWRSWDHVNITDANNVDLTALVIDYIHVNAVDTTADGNVLISCRHFDEIIKIDRNSGDIIWRFGPNSKNNMFTFDNDTVGFSHQHDIQQLKNGNLTLFDNGNFHDVQVSKSLEYEIDEQNLTASLVWEYGNDPAIYSSSKGGSRRLQNGNTILGWGSNWPVVATEVNADGDKKWELVLDSAESYRTMKFDWKTTLFETSFDTIDYGYYNGYEPWPVVVSVTNNADYQISITSASNHNEAFSLQTLLPVVINAGETQQFIVTFFPDQTTNVNYSDVITLNYDSYFADTLHQRISRQIGLKGTTIKPTSVTSPQYTNVVVFPNPVKDMVTIQSSMVIDRILLFNAMGQLVYEASAVNSVSKVINMADNKPGVYTSYVYFVGDVNLTALKIVVE